MPSERLGRAVRRHAWKAALATTLLASGVAPASAEVTIGPPAAIGRWSLPFEEGGLDTPTCFEGADGQLVCKPVAQASALLPDGRVFYYDGFDGQENNSRGPLDSSSAMRDSRSRLLDLRSGTPKWTAPSVATGGASNPSIQPGAPLGNEALGIPGVAGVPGRPGGGPVGSVVGQTGAPGQAPTAPPDDAEANDGDMFCADVAALPDGRLLIVGGTDWYNEPGLNNGEPPVGDVGVPEAEGLAATRLFDPRTDAFSPAGPMKFARWMPGLITLADGKVLVAGGTAKRVKNTQAGNVRRTETFDPDTSTWVENYTSPQSETSLPLAPRMHLMPNGKVLYPGAGMSWAPFGTAADEALYGMQQFFDPVVGTWQLIGPATLGMRDGAASVLLPLDPPYERATALTFGGTLGPPPGGEAGTPLSTLTEVDKFGGVKEKLTRFNMGEGRWFPSAVGLPDGFILAIGGASTSDTTAPGTGLAVRTTELFDPRTETWYPMARTNRDRTFGHSAVLLPDGRVLLGGHAPVPAVLRPGVDVGGPFPNNSKDASFEIFSPHYLFRGPRPTIRRVQAGIPWAKPFTIQTRQALSVGSVVLVRLPSAQQIIDGDARTVRLAFTRRSNALEVMAPPDGVIAPPGYYYLFIMKETRRGPVPSMARVVRIGVTDPADSVQLFPDDSQVPEGSAYTDEDSSALGPVEEKAGELIGNQGPPVSAPPAPAAPAGEDSGAAPSSMAQTMPGAVPTAGGAGFPRTLFASSKRPSTLPAHGATISLLVLAAGGGFTARRRRRR